MKRESPACERNRQPILDVLRTVLRPGARVLEIACGTGQHAEWFATHEPTWQWSPTDLDPEALVSTDAWTTHLPNVAGPQLLDVTTESWPASVDAVYSANMIDISPWGATEGLMRVSAAALERDGVLVTYGPYRVDGAHTAPSNERFEQWLKNQDTRWGVRDLGDVSGAAEARGLRLERTIEMPANNQILVFRRQ